MFKGRTSFLAVPAFLILTTAARGAEELCQIEDWPCAAISASVGTTTVRAIHDPMHRDERVLDGGIADITVRGGQMLTLKWKGQPNSEIKAKPGAKVSVISNRPAAPGCAEIKWADETLAGTKDIDFPACHIGRNFVLTYKMEQGKGKGAEVKTARIRVHVVAEKVVVDDSANRDAISTQPVTPKLAPEHEAEFKQLGEE